MPQGSQGSGHPQYLTCRGTPTRWTPAITATQSRLEGGKGRNERGGLPQYLKCVDAHGKCCHVYSLTVFFISRSCMLHLHSLVI